MKSSRKLFGFNFSGNPVGTVTMEWVRCPKCDDKIRLDTLNKRAYCNACDTEYIYSEKDNIYER